MLQFTNTQMEVFDKIHHEKFYHEIEQYLMETFVDIDEVKRNHLMSACYGACEFMNIQNMDGIFAFYILSFIYGSSINGTVEYQQAHKRNILLGYDPEQLPIDALESLY